MSRTHSAAARPLTLTEELEKLEQSITLMLQEIDHNFSRAHRIVTTSILPIVERYSEHSAAVWDGSKFWKQFFETSANVSLSGVEEREEEEGEEAGGEEQEEDLTCANASTYAESQCGNSTLQPDGVHEAYGQADDSLTQNEDVSGSTPRPPNSKSTEKKAQFANFGSPYEALKQQLVGETSAQIDDETLPATPGATSRIPNMSMTPESSPFDPATLQWTAEKKHGTEPLLHRVLDKNYRVVATPHTTRKQTQTPANNASWRELTSPMSSPPAAAPQLHPELFSSPIRQQYNRPGAPRTPGVSIQTPAQGNQAQVVRDGFIKPITKEKEEITWDSDSASEDAEGIYRELGMSPPKTIQFSLPRSRLLQTPGKCAPIKVSNLIVLRLTLRYGKAREASKRIVEDLLTTAGAALDDTDTDLKSPSIVRKDGLDYIF